MRSIWRTVRAETDPRLLRDISLLCLADALVGLSFGAIAAGGGLPLWLPVALSLVVFAGAAQFLFVGILVAGGSPVAGVMAGLLVNLRHVPLGFAVADVLGAGWLRRLVGTHLMTDESVAFALAEQDAARRRHAYWISGVGLFLCWNLGVLVGVVGGSVVTDTDAFGLDAAFPAVLLALILPALRDRATRTAAMVGSAIAVPAAFLLPAGIPVLLALFALLLLLRTRPYVSEEAA